jgi:hypothetical protein
MTKSKIIEHIRKTKVLGKKCSKTRRKSLSIFILTWIG